MDKILTGKAESRLQSIEFSLELAKVPTFDSAVRNLNVLNITNSYTV